MKIFKVIVFSLFICTSLSNIMAQAIQEKNNKIDSLFNLIKKVTPSKRSELFDSKLLINKKIFINENDLKKVKILMYYSYAHAPIELRKKRNDLFEEWKKTDYNELKPNERRKIVEDALIGKYGKNYVGFLKTPYFMKVEILGITKTIYPTDKKIRGHISQYNFKVKITDILKGKEYYSVGDTLTIAFLPIWFSQSGKFPKFKIGEEYVVPLTHWEKYKSDILKIRLQGLHTLYQVKDTHVYCPLVSESEVVKSWCDFKNEFIQKYLMDK